MEEVLSRIKNGTTIDTIARELDMNKSTLLAMIEFLVDEGYLESVGVGCSCATSRLCEQCRGTNAGPEMAMYTLTGKGMDMVERLNL
ncbi:MAG: FeoC-like transcriptional regulator [Euryarchaeota archaeon]|nr:FeoC-like transcriptional regulator [Euryarchaeota archaeon]